MPALLATITFGQSRRLQAFVGRLGQSPELRFLGLNLDPDFSGLSLPYKENTDNPTGAEKLLLHACSNKATALVSLEIDTKSPDLRV